MTKKVELTESELSDLYVALSGRINTIDDLISSRELKNEDTFDLQARLDRLWKLRGKLATL